MTITAKIGETGGYTPWETKTVGVFKKKQIQSQDFSDLNKIIKHIQEKFGDQYRGLFDLFEFQINGKSCPLWSKCTYEEIFSWSIPNHTGDQYFFGKKDEGTWEHRKNIRTASENMTIYKNSDGKLELGHPDPIIDAKILYDLVLYTLEMASRFYQDKDYKNFLKLFDSAKKLLSSAKKSHDVSYWDDFNPILEYFESIKSQFKLFLNP